MIYRLEIENFRTFRKNILNFERNNVIIGPNSSGKSNLKHLLILLGNLARAQISNAFGPGPYTFRQQLSRPRYRGITVSDTIRIRVFLDLKNINSEIPPYACYSLEFTEKGRNEYLIRGEIVTVGNDRDDICETIFDARNTDIIIGETKLSLRNRDTVLFLSRSNDAPNDDSFAVIKAIRSSLRKIGAFQFNPKLIQKPFDNKFEIRLDYDGNNLASVLYTMQNEYPDNFSALLTDMRSFDKNVSGIFSPQMGFEQIGIGIREVGKKGYFTGAQLSDGILVFLAYVTLKHLPEHQDIMFFEEPESYVHPHKLENILKIIRDLHDVNPSVQTFITTHSPYLLDCVKEFPEEVIIFDCVDGWTKTRRLIDIPHWKEILEGDTLGELWYSNMLGGTPQ